MKPAYVIVVPWAPDYGGGVNEVVLNLYREMLSAGQMTPLIMMSDWSAWRPIERTEDGRRTVFVRLAAPWAKPGGVVRLLKWILTTPFVLLHLLWYCRRRRVAAFDFRYPSLDAFPIALLRRLRLYRGAVILSFQGLDLQEARSAGPIEGALWRFVLRSASAVAACSEALAAEVARFGGPGVKSVHAIHNGVDIDHLHGEIDRSSSLPPAVRERDFILSVATFERKKGLDLLLGAFARVHRAHPSLDLVLVGRSGDQETRLRALALELGVAERVHFYSNVPHSRIGLFFERAKVFCLPSRAEPFGIVLLEAGAYRVPVVATRVGGIPEIIADGESGLLVEPENSDALAQALERVLSDAGAAHEMGERLYQRVATGFSWERAHQALRALVKV